jgi:hypothetical protein
METTLKKKKVRTYSYHVSHSYIGCETNEKFHFMTQLYQIGIYGILNGQAGMQAALEPSDMVRIEKKLNKMQQEGKIKDLQFNRPITVSDATGFWEEVKS